MAFRSLPRPSSALDAKAFTLCSYSLDRNVFPTFAFSFLKFSSLRFAYNSFSVKLLPNFLKVLLAFSLCFFLLLYSFFAYYIVFNVLIRVYRDGGDKRNRTADPLLARQVLSQLSYAPISLTNRKQRII